MSGKSKIILSVVAFVLCTVGCSDSFLETPEPEVVVDNTPQLDIDAARKAFSELPFKTGVNDFELDVLFNKKWAFRLIVPEVEDDELVPLFIDLHGGALTLRPDVHTRGSCTLAPALESTDTKAYTLIPNSQGFLWFASFNETQVVNLVKFAIENLNIDPERVVVFGYSDGGFGSWFFADTHPELFSASIAIAQAYGLITDDEGIKRTEVPVYVIHGEVDELFPYTNTESLVELARNAGSEVELVMAAELGHFRPCDYVPYIEDAIEWVKTSVWE
ncbi:prolyl oligopeptidase family serine peptidase [Ulvibacterium sp.]|uniref:prolyl oligopeptidase family serine peptidase n=1 Tax=Ulvibacterium sp. TaxID=2665914 RepID=UPI0026316F11|nr:prolyl oligopeptidase family serine peptidase [Ulvibacterium sp.]